MAWTWQVFTIVVMKASIYRLFELTVNIRFFVAKSLQLEGDVVITADSHFYENKPVRVFSLNRLLVSLLGVCISSMAFANSLVDGELISHPGDEWLNYGRDYSEQRFSPLQQVNTDNVERLGLAWSYTFPTQRVMEATPLVHDGVLTLRPDGVESMPWMPSPVHYYGTTIHRYPRRT